MRARTALLRITAAIACAALLPTSVATAQEYMHNCLQCHSIHSGLGPSLLKDTDVEVLCLTCHGPAGISVLKAEVHTNQGATFRQTCTDCHTGHPSKPNWLGGTNIKQIGRILDTSGFARIQTPSSGIREVVFESRGTDAAEPSLHSFADNDEDGNGYFDGVCETCHTTTAYHTNNATDPGHHSGETCTDCHVHTESFMPPACIDCHNQVQDNLDGIPPGGRRAVVGEFSFASHHLEATLDDSECKVCHEMTQHQQGYVRLNNVDTGAFLVELLGDPMTSSTEAVKLEPFCLACHDADGAAGSPPFGDGLTPPVIDATDWAASSHTAVTCFGNGTIGCHASGHGSEKLKLRAPYDVAPTPPANEEEEEGFCFNCHDSDGPSTKDIQTAFSAPIRWVTGEVGDLANLNLNDRHDVQYAAQTVSGAKIECTDCHDPHVLNATARLRPDPDPTDGRVPGTGQVLAGADFQSEWCLDCHDGSFPTTVTPPTTALHDVRTSAATDAMGFGGGNATLKSGYGWTDDDFVPCAACHQTTAHVGVKTNLLQLVDLVKSKDGTLDIPSDDFGLNYEVTNNNIKEPQINGWEWCNTCHTGSMGKQRENCFACHYHGTRW